MTRSPDWSGNIARLAWWPAWTPTGGRPFRVAAIPGYKAHRAEPDGTEQTPPGLVVQIPLITQVLTAAGITLAEAAGYEADDVIATLATRATQPVDVVTGDRDLFQLVDDARKVRVLYTIRGLGHLEAVTEPDIAKKYNIPGDRYADFAVLRGDPSDGLPGVPGIGEKTAAILISTFGDLESLKQALDKGHGGFPSGTRKKLEAARSYLDIAPPVVRTATDVPLPDDLDEAAPCPPPRPTRSCWPRWGPPSGSAPRSAASALFVYKSELGDLVTTDPALYPTERLTRVQEAVAVAGIDVLLLTPGPDLRYVTGYDAKQLERLTCLAVPADDDPFLVVPGLELKAAQASPAGQLNVDMIPWGELTDPFAIIAGKVGRPELVALSDRMWALHVLQFAKALPAAGLRLASEVVSPLRMRKTPAEVAALREAGEAIDRVHANVPRWLKAGQTERQVGVKIAEAIFAEGHVSADFVIVGSGPNAASPHHEVSDRVIRDGDVVVVDIGGTMPSGYCSDCTRTYAVGSAPDDFAGLLRGAQARPGGGHRQRHGPASPPRAWTRRPGASSTTPATASGSSTAPATASAWRPTKTRTSSRATPPGSRTAWPSPSSPASTPARTGPASRTSWSAPRPASSG